MNPSRRGPRAGVSPPLPTMVSLLVSLALAAAGLVAPPAASAATIGRVRADDGATVVAEKWLNERTLDITIKSPALGRNANTRLLVPSGWKQRKKRAWPVLYLLHGCCDPDSYASWTKHTDVAAYTAKTPAIVVMPEGDKVGFYTNWWNKGRGGAPAWERFHLTELRQILERGYGAGGRRAIAGLSMGGFGALSYASRHPFMFGAVASFSGIPHTQFSTDTASTPRVLMGIFAAWTPDPYAIWGDPVKQRAIWSLHNPYQLLPLLRNKPIFISTGNGQPGALDPPGTQPDQTEALLYLDTQPYLAKAKKLGIPVTADLYGGGTHSWPYWERGLHRSFPMLARAMGVRAP